MNVNNDFSHDSRLLAVGDNGSTLIIWELSDSGGREVMSLGGHNGPINHIRFSPDDSSLASTSYDGTLRVWDVNSEGSREVLTMAKHQGPVWASAYSRAGDLLATASFDGTLRLWDAGTGQLLHTLEHDHGRIYGVSFSPDGRYLVSGGADFMVRVWEVASGRELMALEGHEDILGDEYKVGGGHPGVLAVAYSPDGSLIVSTGEDSTLRLWDAVSGEMVNVLEVHPYGNGGTGLAFSPDGTRLAVVTDSISPQGVSDGYVAATIFDTASWQVLVTKDDFIDRLWGIAFSPDGTKLAVSGFGGLLSVRDVESGEELFSLPGHTGTVLGVAFSPDGSQLVSVGSDLPKVWDLETREALFSLPGHLRAVVSVAYNSDGSRLATGGDDGIVRIYAMDREELKEIALSRLTRWLRPDECRQYLHSDTCPPKP